MIKKHQTALKEWYKSHGVGKTITQKFLFWESQHPDGYSISHNPTKKQSIWVFEQSWLIQRFPGDFKYA